MIFAQTGQEIDMFHILLELAPAVCGALLIGAGGALALAWRKGWLRR